MVSLEPPVCAFNTPALPFSLPGVDGSVWDLERCRGARGLLVMFICNHCPYVMAVLDRMLRDAHALADHGIGTVAILSNDASEYPADSFDNMQRLAREHNFSFPYLHDESQQVARDYGAVCTPDFFGYNADLGLQYRGRLDASRKQAAAEDTRRDLFLAMQQVAATGQGPTEQIPSMGCSIKWRNE